MAVFAGDGSVTNPSYTFQGDQNTGIFRDIGDSVDVACGGVHALQVHDNYLTINPDFVDYDIRINSLAGGGAYFQIDGTNGNIGTGLSAPPVTQLQVRASSGETGFSVTRANDLTTAPSIRLIGSSATQFAEVYGDFALEVGPLSGSLTEVIRANSSNLSVDVGSVSSTSKLNVQGNIATSQSCIAARSTSASSLDLVIDGLNFLNGGNYRHAGMFIIAQFGDNASPGNSATFISHLALKGLSTWNSMTITDIVGTGSTIYTNGSGTTTGLTVTVTEPSAGYDFISVQCWLTSLTGTQPNITFA